MWVYPHTDTAYGLGCAMSPVQQEKILFYISRDLKITSNWWDLKTDVCLISLSQCILDKEFQLLLNKSKGAAPSCHLVLLTNTHRLLSVESTQKPVLYASVPKALLHPLIQIRWIWFLSLLGFFLTFWPANSFSIPKSFHKDYAYAIQYYFQQGYLPTARHYTIQEAWLENSWNMLKRAEKALVHHYVYRSSDIVFSGFHLKPP